MTEDQRSAGHFEEDDWTKPVKSWSFNQIGYKDLGGAQKDWMMLKGDKGLELMPMQEWKWHFLNGCFCGPQMLGLWLVHKEVRN